MILLIFEMDFEFVEDSFLKFLSSLKNLFLTFFKLQILIQYIFNHFIIIIIVFKNKYFQCFLSFQNFFDKKETK